MTKLIIFIGFYILSSCFIRNQRYEKNMYKTVRSENKDILNYKNYLNNGYVFTDTFENGLKEINIYIYRPLNNKIFDKIYTTNPSFVKCKDDFIVWFQKQYPLITRLDSIQDIEFTYYLTKMRNGNSYKSLILYVNDNSAKAPDYLKQAFQINYIDNKLTSIIKIGEVFLFYTFYKHDWTLFQNNFYIYNSFSGDHDAIYSSKELTEMRKANIYFNTPEYYCKYSIDEAGYIKIQ